jgi:hypothetical protein
LNAKEGSKFKKKRAFHVIQAMVNTPKKSTHTPAANKRGRCSTSQPPTPPPPTKKSQRVSSAKAAAHNNDELSSSSSSSEDDFTPDDVDMDLDTLEAIAIAAVTKPQRGRGRGRGRGQSGRATTKVVTKSITQWVVVQPQPRTKVADIPPKYTGPAQGSPSTQVSLSFDAHPIDFFDLFLPPHWRAQVFTKHTNKSAVALGAGAEIYPDWIPFTTAEIDSALSLLIRNGLHPVPDMTLNFLAPEHSFVWGDKRVREVFPGGARRWKMFRRFFCVADPLVLAAANKPLQKIEPLLKQILKRSKELWDLGPVISIDEQTIGFQGRSAHAQRINYKSEGDGFQADAICQDGYTWCFHFRHDPHTVLEPSLSPLHNRCLSMLKQIPDPWITAYMDNLYPSTTWFELLKSKYSVLACGVVRKNRGIPASVIQEEVTSRKTLDSIRGTVKIAHTSDGLVVVSVYDTKPVHMLTTAHHVIHMTNKTRIVWDSEIGRQAEIQYSRLNVIDDYNKNMHMVDVADQLRTNYRIDGPWMRYRKWWWAIFSWALGMVCVNSYLLYKRVCQRSFVTPMSHRRFRELVAEKLAYPQGGGTQSTSPAPNRVRAPKLTWESISNFPRSADMHPLLEPDAGKQCQWCRLTCDGLQKTARIQCGKCFVLFCGPKCWNEFHSYGL